MDFNSMFGGMNINDLMNNPNVKEMTDSIKSNGANENAVLAMITNMLEDKNNAEMVERLVTGLKPSLNDEEKKIVDTIVISSPITGLAADLSTTPDEAFAGRMMGDGAVVTPEDAIVRAPEDGEVCFVFDTKHAIGFMTESGVSLLIHVGIDTVKLDGKGFECFVENGQAVRKGDPMLKLDLDYLRENAPSVASPVLCTELEDNQKIRLLNEGEIKAGDELFAIDIYEA